MCRRGVCSVMTKTWNVPNQVFHKKCKCLGLGAPSAWSIVIIVCFWNASMLCDTMFCSVFAETPRHRARAGGSCAVTLQLIPQEQQLDCENRSSQGSFKIQGLLKTSALIWTGLCRLWNVRRCLSVHSKCSGSWAECLQNYCSKSHGIGSL